MRRCVLVIVCGLAACGDVDPPPPDAPPVEVTLSQTNSDGVTSGFACRNGTTMFIRDNSFYRAFTLADHGVTEAFRARKVAFGVFSATSGSATKTQPLEVAVYAYAGAVGGETIDLSKLTRHGGAQIEVPDTTAPTVIDVPIDAELPAGTTGLVAELHVPDGSTGMHQMLIGANQQGERTPAFQRALACGQTNPVTLPAAGLALYALVLSVTGDTNTVATARELR